MTSEELFENWYDNRSPIYPLPPASFESWKAGWDAAKNEDKVKELCQD